jgi:hypothetical protein
MSAFAPRMQPWQRKAAIDAVKASIPAKRALRALQRRWRPYQDNRSNSLFAFQQGLEQLSMLRDAGIATQGTVLEFGSGWVPVIPAMFHVAGADRLIVTDVERLMDSHTLDIAKRIVGSRLNELSDFLGTTDASLKTRLDEFHPTYIAPWMAADMPTASIDVLISRTVLEHVPVSELKSFLTQFRRLVRPGGAMCHIVDNSDHWEHHDKSLSRVNFLRFSDRDLWWQIGCRNPQSFQNRLRHSDYAAIFATTGWDIVCAKGDPDSRCLDDLERLPVAPAFHRYDRSDLAILTSYFVVQPRE